MDQKERFIRELAGLGNLFLILTLPELRRQGMTYLSLYALQRAVHVAREHPHHYFPESSLRNETGLEDYETSRACTFLAKSLLVKLSPAADDGRERLLIPTERGERVLNKIMKTAGVRLSASIDEFGRFRRIREATMHMRKVHARLYGPFQLSFFEREARKKKPKSAHQ